MMVTSFMVLLFLAAAGSSHGYYLPNGGYPFSRLANCVGTRPCHIQVEMRFFNGSVFTQLSSDDCSCGRSRPCRDVDQDSDYVIHRNLISTEYNVTLSMVFCDPVQPKRSCVLGEVALELAGPSTIPQQIVSYNCRCDEDGTLQLHQRSIGPDYLTHESYVCEEHKAICPRRISPCLVIREEQDTVDYDCRCPRDFHCRPDPHSNNAVTFGYCRV